MSDTKSNTINDLAGIIFAALLQGAIYLVLFVAFSILRPRHRILYEPRTKFAPKEKRPQPLEWHPTAWLGPTLFTDENQLVAKIGLDAVMFLRFIRFCLVYFLGLTAVGGPLCLFHYFAPRIIGKSRDNDDASANDPESKSPSLNVLTMQNVNADSAWFWLHAILVWIFSVYAYYLLYRLWIDWISFRREYFSTPEFQHADHSGTLLLTNLPESMRSSGAVSQFMHSLNLKYPIRQAMIGRDVGELPKLIKEHQQETAQLEAALATYLKDPYRPAAKRPTHRVGKRCYLVGGERVDSINYCGDRIRELEEQIYELRSKEDDYFQPTANAFVSFSSVGEAHWVASKLRTPAAIALRSRTVAPPAIRLSPDFDDIIWDNIGMTGTLRNTRRLMAVGLVLAVILSWAPLIVFVTGLSRLSRIRRFAPSLAKWIAGSEVATVFLASIFSPSLFAIMMYVLPPIGFRLLARFQGVLSNTGVEKSVMHKVFVFQLYQCVSSIMVDFGVETIGTWLKSGRSADSILHDIGNAFVSQPSFFIPYILTSLSSGAIELIQGVPLVLGFVKRHLFANTPRQVYEYSQPPALPYAPIYALLLIKFLLAAAYSVTTPLILPFTALVFFALYLVYKYQVIYVYETPLETGGSWWPKVFTMVCVGISALQLMTMGAILLLSAGSSTNGNGKAQSTMVLVMVVMGVLFWWACHKWLAPQGYFVSKSEAGIVQPATERCDATERALEDRVYNPALVKPLWRVWVWKQARQVLRQYYEPQYRDLNDYVSQRRRRRRTSTVVHNVSLGSTYSQGAEKQADGEDDEEHLAAVTMRRDARRVMAFLHRHPVHQATANTEVPPELEQVARDAGSSLPVVMAEPEGQLEDGYDREGQGYRYHDRQGCVPVPYAPAADSPSAVLQHPVELVHLRPREDWAEVRSFASSEPLCKRTPST